MEPIILGSPVNGPNSSQGQCLPPFLMGDPQVMTPKPGRFVSFAPPPTGTFGQDFTRPGINTFFGLGGAPHGYGGHGHSLPNVSLSGVSSHNLQTAPPTQGLFESLREQQYNTQQRLHLSKQNQSQNLNLRFHQSHQNHNLVSFASPPTGTFGHDFNRPGINTLFGHGHSLPNVSLSGVSSHNHQTGPPTQGLFESLLEHPYNNHLSMLNQSQNVDLRLNQSYLISDPQYLQYLNTPRPRLGDSWVTIFGFVPGSSSMVLQHFTLYGTIVLVSHAPENGNWMHVCYSSRIESDKALNCNQKIIGHNVMVGVTRCTDISITQNDVKVTQSTDLPTKSTGLLNTAIDVLFGW
ncbi:nucleoporin Nup35 [Drosophila guanche]|uniref:Nucleoporin NUP53 n=1 Tax=Drosophila guanche TaxID=7266 RepID=A0A3B0K3A9_DROGU|nr:nucleoporin Nup35 [Drosophila guanche]SPP77908.1 blast:Nucleoporin NUP53 [Drosophila guanche]